MICIICSKQLVGLGLNKITSIFSAHNNIGQLQLRSVTVSIIDALTCLFPTSSVNSLIFPDDPGKFLVCTTCGTALSTLYGAYFQLLHLSNVNSRITGLVKQIQIWHSFGLDKMVDGHIRYLDALRCLMPHDSEIDVKIEESELPDPDRDPLVLDNLNPDYIVIEDEVKEEEPEEIPLAPVAPSNHLPPLRESLKRKAKSMINYDYNLDLELDPEIENDPLDPDPEPQPSTSKLQRISSPEPEELEQSKSNDIDNGTIEMELPRKRVKDIFNIPTAHSHGFIRYPCPSNDCSKVFLFKYEMELHFLNGHQHLTPESCKVCGFLYFNEELFKKHHCITRRARRDKGLEHYRCVYCGLCPKNSVAFHHHRKIHEEGYVAPEVKRQERKMEKDKKFENDEIPTWNGPKTKKNPKTALRYTCKNSECPDLFLFKWEAEMHFLITHENTIQEECSKCNFKYLDDKLFKEHSCIAKEQRDAEGLIYRCNYCGRCFKNTSLWVICRRSHCHELDIRRFKCPIDGCEKRLLSPKFLKTHIARKHKPKPKPLPRPKQPKLPCAECGKVLSKGALRMHMQQKHSTGLEKNKTCHICGKSFYANNILKNHIVYRHSTFRAYKCPLCSVSFKGSQELRTHWKGKIHSKEETEELLKSKVQPNVKPDEIPILPKGSKNKTYKDSSTTRLKEK